MQPSRGFQPIPYGERPQNEKPGGDDSIGVLEYLRIVQRHRGTIILFAFLGLLAAVLYTMPQTPLFRARTVIEVQDINNDFLNTRSVNPVADDNQSNVLTDVQTQMKIIQSDQLIDRVIQKLKSEGKLPPVRSTSRFAALKKLLNLPENKDSDPDYTLEQAALRSLTIHQLGQTRVLEILYTSPNPKFASDFVNTLTSEYVESNLEARWRMSERTETWLNKQLDDMRVKLERSEAALQEYAERSGLLFTTPASGSTEKTNVSEDKLRQLQAGAGGSRGGPVALRNCEISSPGVGGGCAERPGVAGSSAEVDGPEAPGCRTAGHLYAQGRKGKEGGGANRSAGGRIRCRTGVDH
jgi:uncharacterized protein involved in exopolysaccharide biosynthesis